MNVNDAVIERLERLITVVERSNELREQSNELAGEVRDVVGLVGDFIQRLGVEGQKAPMPVLKCFRCQKLRPCERRGGGKAICTPCLDTTVSEAFVTIEFQSTTRVREVLAAGGNTVTIGLVDERKG